VFFKSTKIPYCEKYFDPYPLTKQLGSLLRGVICEEFVDPGSRFNPGFQGRIEQFLLMNIVNPVVVCTVKYYF
jgi:hypothetical protein